MEYLNSGLLQGQHIGMQQAKDAVQPLLDQCRLMKRERDGDLVTLKKRSNRLEAMVPYWCAFLRIKE